MLTQNLKSEILNLFTPAGVCKVEVAATLETSTQSVKNVLEELEKEGLIQFDDYQTRWYLVPQKERLELLKKEIRQIGESVRLAFYEVGIRLKEIRDKKLYELDGYADFNEFVSREFGFKKVYAHYQIHAAQVYNDILPCESASKLYQPETKAFTSCEQLCIKESHLRPLTRKDLTSDDRARIWNEVQQELESDSKPSLTSKLVEKHVMKYQKSQVEKPPELPDLSVGTYARIRLRNLFDSNLKAWHNKIVKVIDKGELNTYTVQGCFGEEIQDQLFRDELIELADTATAKFNVNLTIEQLKLLPQLGSLEAAINALLADNSNVLEFKAKTKKNTKI